MPPTLYLHNRTTRPPLYLHNRTTQLKIRFNETSTPRIDIYPPPTSPMNPIIQPVMFPPHPPVPFPPPSPHMSPAGSFDHHRAANLPQANPPALQGTAMGFQPMQIPANPAEIPMPNSYTTITPITNEWRTGLLDCMLDPELVIQTALFPCVTIGQVAEIVDKGETSCGTSGLLYAVVAASEMPWLLSCMYRAELRKRYGIEEGPAAPDWAVHLFCEWCALCQKYRELQLRGMDPSVGWLGNMENDPNMQQQQVTMTPPMNQAMMG